MDNLFFYLLPILTAVNLIMLIVWTYKCRREFDSLFNNAGKKTFFAVVFIFCLSLFLKLILVVPKHLYYNDEFYYMITAKNILLHINAGPYLKSSGWSVIIAIMFAVFGINNYVAIGTSIFFGALTTINIFLLVYFIFKDRYLAILSAVIFSIMPDHIFFSATAERSVVSIFFVTFSVLAMLLYFQNERKNLLWLSLLGISFASQIRPENYIFLALFVIGFYIFLKRWPDFKDNIWFIAACLCLPNLIWNCHYHSGLIINPAHSSYFNTVKCFLNLFDGSLYPLLFILLFSTGFLCLWYRKALYNLFIFLGFLALCLIYSYDWEGITLGYGFYTKTRFYICLYPFLIIWFAAGVSFFLDRFKNKKIRHCVFFSSLNCTLIFIFTLFGKCGIS